MANEEHLEILKKGVEIWNRWRSEHHGDISPDLSNAQLQGMVFTGADLSETNLKHADLSETNLIITVLTRANLFAANLTLAKLIGANIYNAILREAKLRAANLTSALCYRTDFTGADLGAAIISGTDLRESNFDKVKLGGTHFAFTDLRRVKNIDTCEYLGPCSIDHETLIRSDKLPLSFLHGCGLPNNYIDYLPSFRGEAIQFYSCFISYATEDQEFTDRLYADLQAKGIRCWYAPHDIRGGEKLDKQLERAIRLHDRLLLVISEYSMESEWVKTEIANARKKEKETGKKVLFPISLVDFEVIKEWKCFDADIGKDSAREIREYFIPGFQNWKDHDSYQKAFNKLLRDLKAASK